MIHSQLVRYVLRSFVLDEVYIYSEMSKWTMSTSASKASQKKRYHGLPPPFSVRKHPLQSLIRREVVNQ